MERTSKPNIVKREEKMKDKLEETVIKLCDSVLEILLNGKRYGDFGEIIKAIAELTAAIASLKD